MTQWYLIFSFFHTMNFCPGFVFILHPYLDLFFIYLICSLTMGCTMAAGQSQLWCLEHLLPLLLHWPGSLQDSCSHTLSLQSPRCCCTTLCPHSQICYCGSTALDSGRSFLEFSGTFSVHVQTAWGIFSQKPLLQLFSLKKSLAL